MSDPYNPGPPLRVLVADDDPIQRSLVAARLAPLNARAFEAEDGGQAWHLLTSNQFDLAIVDLNMPNIDGTTLIRCIRAHARTRHMPIVVITGSNDLVVIEESFAAGASSFMSKPIVWSTFQHHIGFLLRLVSDARNARIELERAQAVDRAKETVLGNLCRETRAAVTSVLAEVEQLRRPASIAAGGLRPYERLERIEADLAGIGHLAGKAATVVDAICSKIRVDDRREDLADLVDRACHTITREAADAGVALSIATLPASLLACDGEAIQLALVELLRNAVAGSAAGQTVTISATIHPDGLLAIEVTDNGRGIDPERLAASLAPLRVEVEYWSRQDHIGFGLPLAKAIVEAHSGKLEVRSMPGEGTTALLALPPDRVIAESAAA